MTEMTIIKRCDNCGYYDSNGANFCKTCGSKLVDVSEPLYKEIEIIKELSDRVCHLYFWTRQRGYAYDISKLGYFLPTNALDFEIKLPERKIASMQMPRMTPMPEDEIQARSTATQIIKILSLTAISCFLLRYIIGDILLLILLMTVVPIVLFCVIVNTVKEGKDKKSEVAQRLQPHPEYQRKVERANNENAQKLAIAKEQMLIRQRELDREYINDLKNWIENIGKPFYEYTQQWIIEHCDDHAYAVKQYDIKRRNDELRKHPLRTCEITPEEIQELHESHERSVQKAIDDYISTLYW